MATRVMDCDCVNVQQDKIHGNRKRVFNKTAKKSGDSSHFRCTSCGKDKVVGGGAAKIKK